MIDIRLVRTRRRTLVAVLGCLLALIGWLRVTPAAPVAAANTLHVTDCGDTGANTLRGKIGAAGVGDTIVFDQNCTITLSTGTLTLATNNLTISGTGHTVVVDGGCTANCGTASAVGGVTVFTVNPNVTASLNALTIRHGNTGGSGGGIANSGTLSVTNSTLSANSAQGSGGGISNTVTLTVTNSIISGNSAGDGGGGSGGGGISNNSSNGINTTLFVTNSIISGNSAGDGGGVTTSMYGTGTVTNSTLSGNSATSDGGGGGGGGIYNLVGLVTVTSSTLAGNSAGGSGGGIDNQSYVTVTNSTLSANHATLSGGGIENYGDVSVTNSTLTGNSAGIGGGISNQGAVAVTNTIVAGNTGTAGVPDLSGRIGTGGHNLFGTTTGALITLGPGDLVNPTPLLGTLGSNGGPTQTIPLLPGSPAIAHGDPAVCAAIGAGMVNGLDQRGVARPRALCAIGAFEPLLSAISPSSGSVTGGGTVTLTGTGYAAGATVSLGGASCTNVQVVNGTILTCTTGPHAAGVVDVVVTVNSQTGTLTGGYTYAAVAPLPPSRPTGPVVGPANPLPPPRPPGPTGGPPPNPLPPPRP